MVNKLVSSSQRSQQQQQQVQQQQQQQVQQQQQQVQEMQQMQQPQLMQPQMQQQQALGMQQPGMQGACAHPHQCAGYAVFDAVRLWDLCCGRCLQPIACCSSHSKRVLDTLPRLLLTCA
jgi:hypothetical protein